MQMKQMQRTRVARKAEALAAPCVASLPSRLIAPQLASGEHQALVVLSSAAAAQPASGSIAAAKLLYCTVMWLTHHGDKGSAVAAAATMRDARPFLNRRNCTCPPGAACAGPCHHCLALHRVPPCCCRRW